MLTMYAIPNCDTVKKARAFLDKKKIAYEFVDFKKTPPTKELVNKWIDFLGELPVNKKGTTFRKLKDEYETLSPSKQIDFMIANSSMIKRPILENKNKTIAVGFDEEVYAGLKLG
ncbi:Spx/MgsR family RNA polymerase-binding regulatory protein [Bacteriovorax sp. PP10]|uniref:Spx/MgsR family RNA polymerase-binding regulatory protein n=1 Tax=Bacteriovorax antarcticus TaxID=3088717 RepID=A0ABU5VV67_9BACT|nr:Spx/MgsR family RNA polymerase-binding regulatory protein [Bacteriovorax sp. PP10]MEA9356950.1 Spx/MgsR family RNA polymerase-binding regulatory protein [Bacteriovorax sp. PP10]